MASSQAFVTGVRCTRLRFFASGVPIGSHTILHGHRRVKWFWVGTEKYSPTLTMAQKLQTGQDRTPCSATNFRHFF
jgi:hypothetical protein